MAGVGDGSFIKFISGLGQVTSNGDGTYTTPNGKIVDKWGNNWNPSTGAWYNPDGGQWYGTDPASGTGIFGQPDSYIDTTGKVIGGAGGGIDLSSLLNGGGAGSGPGYTQLDQDAFNHKVDQDLWQRDFDLTQFNHKKAIDQRDYALALGDQALAKQKQADANHWQQQGMLLQQQLNAQDNQTRIATAQIDANAAIQTAAMRADADRYASKLRLQEGLANAHNDAQRNQILLAHEQEMAAIAKMEDDTKRAIAAKDSQINAFNAETTRQYQMGDLALKNNQFLMDSATNPRNLFGLYFMQRGLTPDWDSMAAGNAPIQGQALQVYDPMKAYNPTVQLPQDFNIGPGAAYGGVGSAAGGTTLAANPYMNMNMVPDTGSGGGSAGGTSGGGTGGFTMPDFSIKDIGMPTQIPTDINPAGLQGGVPAAALKPGLNLSTVGGAGAYGSDFDMGTAYYDQGKTKAVGAGDYLDPGVQVWVDYPIQRNFAGTDRYAFGTDKRRVPGYTRSGRLMAGDSRRRNPFAGGARPEIIENPTNAPIRVLDTQQTQRVFQNPMAQSVYNEQGQMVPNPNFVQPTRMPRPGMPRQVQLDYPVGFENTPVVTPNIAQPGQILNYGNDGRGFDMNGGSVGAGFTNWTGFSGNPYASGGGQAYKPTRAPVGQTAGYGNGVYSGSWGTPGMGGAVSGNTGNLQWQKDSMVSNLGQRPTTGIGIDRFALGTDLSQQYGNMGQGHLWMNSSNNAHLDRSALPNRLGMLADYGVPLSPSLAAGATGTQMPTLNVSSAFQQRGGGMLPSLQTMNNMTKGELENFRGYAEGVVGVPWADIVDYLGKPTQNLQTARASRGLF